MTLIFAFGAACIALLCFALWRKVSAQAQRLAALAAAEALLEQARVTQHDLTARLSLAESERDALRQQLAQSETALALAEQTVEMLSAQKKSDAEILEEVKQSTRAGVLHVSQELSSKLLDDARREREAEAQKRELDMKREREESRLQLEAILRNVTTQLQELQGKAASLDGSQKRLAQDLETINRTLTSPIGGGAQAEIGFENLLTNLGLLAGQDFFLQYQFTSQEGRTLRPDCVVLLPQETALVIDCKSSPYVLELAAAEGGPDYESVLRKFASSMHTHLKSLASKEYAAGIEKLLQTEVRKPVSRLISVMYCPTEAALERVMKFDPSLREKASLSGIVLAGPASLQGLFKMAQLQVIQAQQSANQQQIVTLLAQWMNDVIGALAHADKIGVSIRRAMEAYDDLAGSVNRNVLGRLQRLIALGVEPAKSGAMPKRLPRYDIQRHEEGQGEVALPGEPPLNLVSTPQDKDAA